MQYKCLLICLLLGQAIYSQNYHAIQGSSYAGSLGVGNNPASIVNTPYRWDIDIFSLQVKNATNAVSVYNYSLLSSPVKSQYSFTPGDFKRKADFNYNINLLNARFALNRRQAIAFGCNIRGYGRAVTSPFNYNDTLSTAEQFFAVNGGLRSASLDFAGSSWIELFGTYGQTLWDRPGDRLNAAITLKVSRGIGGGYARLRDGLVQQEVQGNKIVYLLENATGQYGYSSNFDSWQNNRSTSQNLRNFLNRTEAGMSVDLGIEYLIKDQGIGTVYDEDSYYDYDWKIGVSLLDLGFNKYRYGSQSRTLSGIRTNIDGNTIDNRFSNIKNLGAFNDSVATIVNNMSSLPGAFKIYDPARLVVNVDRWLTNAFYINGELSLNLSPLAGNNRLYTRELNLLTITPRWETKRWGIYLPLQYNVAHRFMIGAAFKAGPLLLGFHNLGNIFLKNKMQNGGGYIAFVIRSGRGVSGKGDKRNDCPPGQ